MEELVSIIVTSYNHAEFLDQRMESLLNQTYQNVEIIVVDDCSTDNSLAVLAPFKRDPNVFVKALEKNHGYAEACNIGVGSSRGDFIMFAECDDFNSPTHVENLLTCFHCHSGIGVAFCKSHMVDGYGNMLGDDFRFRENAFKEYCHKDTVIFSQDIQRFFLIHCVIPNMSAALINKKYYEAIGGFDQSFRVCADWDFWCRISTQCDFYYMTEPMNNFRTHRTTVRNTSGVKVTMTEIFWLLHSAVAKTNLSSAEKFRFKVNLGHIWASFFMSNPAAWLRSFLGLLKTANTYNKWSLIYLLCGMAVKAKTSILKKMFGYYSI